MKVESIRVRNLRLEALASDQEKPVTVFMVHGNSSSAGTFRPLFESDIISRARLVSVSLPGHAGSERATEPGGYRLPALQRVLLDCIEALGSEHLVLCGHSLGGHLLSEVLPQVGAIRGLILISAPPLNPETIGSIFRPDPTAGAVFGGELDAPARHRFASKLLQSPPASDADFNTLMESIGSADPSFRPTLGQSILSGEFGDELAHLRGATFPVAVLGGAKDPFIQGGVYDSLELPSLWRNGAEVIAHTGHSPHLEAPEHFVRFVSAFLDQVATS